MTTFLLSIKRAKWVLDNMRVSYLEAKRLVWQRFLFVRTKLLQFVNNIDNYMMTRVRHRAWFALAGWGVWKALGCDSPFDLGFLSLIFFVLRLFAVYFRGFSV